MILWSTPPELDTVLRSIRVLPGLYGLPVVQKQLIEPVVGMGADTRDQAAKRLEAAKRIDSEEDARDDPKRPWRRLERREERLQRTREAKRDL